MPRDYYSILGVSPDASLNDIKKSYRKLALKWHPDKNVDNQEQANKKFKEITEAYEILSDDNKRKLYNRRGMDDWTNGRPRSGVHSNKSHQRHYNYDDPFDIGLNFTNFSFREPEEVFREFFNMSTEILDLFPGRSVNHGRFGSGFDSRLDNMTNLMRNSRISTTNGEYTVKSKSINTRVVNGKKFTTIKTSDGGHDIIEKYEDDVLKSRTCCATNLVRKIV